MSDNSQKSSKKKKSKKNLKKDHIDVQLSLTGELRKTTRISIPIKLRCKWLDSKGKYEDVEIHNISGGGMNITMDKPHKKGAKLKSLLYFPNDSKPIPILGRVVWCKKTILNNKINYRLGINHVEIGKRHKARFVNHLCETMLIIYCSQSRDKSIC